MLRCKHSVDPPNACSKPTDFTSHVSCHSKIVDNSLIAIDKTGFLGTTDGSQFRLGIPVGNDVRAVLLRLSLGLGLLSFGAVAQANADTTFQFLYTATDGSGITAGGTLTTGAADGSGFDITSVTGSYFNGSTSSTITGLIDPATCAASSPCDLFSPPVDDLLFLTTPYLSSGGFAFTDSNNETANIFFSPIANDYETLALDPSGDVTAFADGSFAIPLPGSLPLLGTALVVGYFMFIWRRRRESSSAMVV